MIMTGTSTTRSDHRRAPDRRLRALCRLAAGLMLTAAALAPQPLRAQSAGADATAEHAARDRPGDPAPSLDAIVARILPARPDGQRRLDLSAAQMGDAEALRAMAAGQQAQADGTDAAHQAAAVNAHFLITLAVMVENREALARDALTWMTLNAAHGLTDTPEPLIGADPMLRYLIFDGSAAGPAPLWPLVTPETLQERALASALDAAARPDMAMLEGSQLRLSQFYARHAAALGEGTTDGLIGHLIRFADPDAVIALAFSDGIIAFRQDLRLYGGH